MKHASLPLRGFRRPGSAPAPWREFAGRGGLMSQGARIADSCRLAAIYRGGSRKRLEPAELPVPHPTKLELVIDPTSPRRPESKCWQVSLRVPAR
jgi:hypothetical protein